MRLAKWILGILLVTSAAAFGQTQVASDPFTYSDNASLATGSGGNWAVSGSAEPFRITSNKAANLNGTTIYAEGWTGSGTFANDQYCQVTLSTSGSSSKYQGCALRVTTGATASFYYFMCSSVNCEAGTRNGAGNTSMQSATAHGLSLPLTLYAEIQGTTLVFKVNGSTPAGFSASYTRQHIFDR